MATKIIKTWIDGAVQEIEVEDIVTAQDEASIEDRLDFLENEQPPIITDGNFLVGNGTTECVEMTPSEVLSHINGASIVTLTSDEYNALGDDEANANVLYIVTDDDEDAAILDAFYTTGSFALQYDLYNNYAVCSGIGGCTDTSVEIGRMVQNLPVTSIGDNAFANYSKLTSITIPKSITNIGYRAFYNCTKLARVYYAGTAEEWATMTIGSDNYYLANARIYYNS